MAKKFVRPVFLLLIIFFGLYVTMQWLLGSRRRHAALSRCNYNLNEITIAKLDWARDYHKLPNDIPTSDDLLIYLKDYMVVHEARDGLPACPQGGVYVIGRVNEYPKCSIDSDQHRISLPFPLPTLDIKRQDRKYGEEARSLGLK